MTYSDLATEIQTRAGDNTIDDTQLTRWVNLANKQIAARTDWPWITTEYTTDVTVANQTEYTLQTNFEKMISVRVGESSTATEDNATEYTFIPYSEKNLDWSGQNVYYLNPATSSYGILPEPSTAGLPIFQKYFAIPADVTSVVGNITSSPPFPGGYHELIIFYCLKKYWEMNDDGQKATYYNSEFENTIELMKNDTKLRSTGQLGRMKDIREFKVGVADDSAY